MGGAGSTFDPAPELAPKDAVACLSRGAARQQAGDLTGAIADFDRALSLEPDNICGYIARGNARYQRYDLRCLVDYRLAFRLQADATARKIVRLLAEEVRQAPETVLENCAQHLQRNNSDVMAYARRGLTLLLLGRDNEAQADFDRFLGMIPDMREHLRRLSDLARAASERVL